jgi:hypothetical protein
MSWFEESFFYRLWVNCDDYGRMDARPAIIKSKLFPLKDRMTLKDIESALNMLADIGCVRLYVCDNKPYLYLPSWEVHQNIRAKKSKYPAPGDANAHEYICKQMQADDCRCPRNPIQSESNPNPNPNKEPVKTAIEIAIDDFTEMRKKIKKPLTDKAKKLILSKLDSMAHDDETKIEILEQSTMNSWQGVFPLKGETDGREHDAGRKKRGDGNAGESVSGVGIVL